MCNLKHRPQHLMLLLPFVARVLGVFEFVLEFEEGVFDVVEAFGWGFAGFTCGS